jgi:succinate dehydrogenase flavin-adding protein (antitoxin of CptAB toxin-antitoxin module)
MTTRIEALTAAKRHHETYGDTLDEHDPEDYGSLLDCPDCDWAVLIEHAEFS